MSTAATQRTTVRNHSEEAAGDGQAHAALRGSFPGWRRRVRHVQWLGWTLALAGCTTVGPDFVQPKAPVPEQWQEADSAVVTRKPALVFIVFPDALTQGFTGDDPTMKFYQRIVDYLLVTTYSVLGVLVYDAIVERVTAWHRRSVRTTAVAEAVDAERPR
jgi:hypothetical protein